MTHLRNFLLAGSMLFVAATGLSAQGAMVSCTDGSTSAGGRGACSGHGGIAAAKSTKASMKADAKSAKTEIMADAKIAKADAKAAAAKADAKTEAAAKKADAKSSAMKADAKADAKMARAEAKAAAEKADAKADVRAARVEKKAARNTVEDDNAIAAGATATCKDGTYSHSKTHQGSCSRHGGVAKFMDAK
jgi:hypothetical protein